MSDEKAQKDAELDAEWDRITELALPDEQGLLERIATAKAGSCIPVSREEMSFLNRCGPRRVEDHNITLASLDARLKAIEVLMPPQECP